jgi:hypothetical protein
MRDHFAHSSLVFDNGNSMHGTIMKRLTGMTQRLKDIQGMVPNTFHIIQNVNV